MWAILLVVIVEVVIVGIVLMMGIVSWAGKSKRKSRCLEAAILRGAARISFVVSMLLLLMALMLQPSEA